MCFNPDLICVFNQLGKMGGAQSTQHSLRFTFEIRPHDLHRHAATYASRSGVPIESASNMTLRHADLSTTQRYLGKVSDHEAIRWIESLHGWVSRHGRDYT